MENHSFIKFVPGVYVIYLSVPKVASSSISCAMLNTQPTVQSEMSEHSPEGKALTNWRPAKSPHPELPIFTFTRHPIEKFISYYKDKFIRARGQGFELDHLKKLKFDPGMSLEEVVRHMMTIPVEKMEHHGQPQYRIILNEKSELIPDFVGKVEEIEWDWKYIKALSLIDFKVDSVKNKTSYSSDELNIDEPIISALSRYYSYDFDLFGYEKPLYKDQSIEVVRPKNALQEDKLNQIKNEIQERRKKYIFIAGQISQPDLFNSYADSMKKAFNGYLVHANKNSAKSDALVLEKLRRLKRLFTQ